MIFIYLLSFFALLPIFAYLLNQGTTNKGYILGIATIIILLCIFSFIGKFSYLGFFEEQELTNEMKDDIRNDDWHFNYNPSINSSDSLKMKIKFIGCKVSS